MKKIITNKIQCNTCKDIIESKYTHDFQTCSCGQVSVDGGRSYLKRCFQKDPNEYKELSVYKDYTDAEIAYEAYRKQSGGVSLYSGDKLPDFEKLKPAIQDCWYAASEAVSKSALQQIWPGLF